MSNICSRTSFFEKKTALLFFSLLILAVTFFRFWYATQLELIGDEAYYWYCSRHLDWSFFDKGPGAALTIWLGTHLFGDTVFGVRFFAVLLSAATGIALFFLARILFSQRAACWTLLLALFMPLYAVGSILMTIDPLSIFFWTVAAITFWQAIKSDRFYFWILTGAFVGLGMLAKYTNLVELLCFALFCFLRREERHQLKRVSFYSMLAVTSCFALPILIWNIEHHWIGLVHLIHRGDLDHAWSVKPGELLTFLGAQAGVISPLFFAGMIASVFWPQYDEAHKKATSYLRCLFIPLFVFYSFLSLNKAAEPNWTAPCYIAGMVLLAGNWDALQRRWSLSKKWIVAAFMIAAFETVMLHDTWWLHVSVPQSWQTSENPLVQKIAEAYRNLGAVDPLDRARGPESIAQHALELSQQYKTDFFISDNYQMASLLSFYLPGHPDTYQPDWGRIKDQFSIWPGYKERYPLGSNALFIFEWTYSPKELRRDFNEVQEIDQSYSMTGKRPIKKYYYSLCVTLR